MFTLGYWRISKKQIESYIDILANCLLTRYHNVHGHRLFQQWVATNIKYYIYVCDRGFSLKKLLSPVRSHETTSRREITAR